MGCPAGRRALHMLACRVPAVNLTSQMRRPPVQPVADHTAVLQVVMATVGAPALVFQVVVPVVQRPAVMELPLPVVAVGSETHKTRLNRWIFSSASAA